MTLLEFEELCEYWREQPPVHLAVAAFLGIKPQGDRRSLPIQANEPEPFPMQLFGVPGLGPTRPFSAEFGPEAIGELRDLWQRYEAAQASSKLRN